jgi:hypothetical protein
MEPQTTTNKMVDPSELEQSTPQRSQYISGKKRNNSDSPDSYSPSDKQLEKQPRTYCIFHHLFNFWLHKLDDLLCYGRYDWWNEIGIVKGSTDHIRKLNNRITRDLVNKDIVVWFRQRRESSRLFLELFVDGHPTYATKNWTNGERCNTTTPTTIAGQTGHTRRNS